MNIWHENDLMEFGIAPQETEPDYHYHSCPKCFIYDKCSMSCSIETDLGFHNDKPFGSTCLCDACEEELKSKNKFVTIYSKDWWEIYNGFARPRPYLDEYGIVRNWYSME